jgi:hypothetical protein
VSIRDERPAQILADEVRPLGEWEPVPPITGEEGRKKLFLKIPAAGSREDKRIMAMLQLFPGPVPVRIVYGDTGKRMGGECGIGGLLLEECRALLGAENVVVRDESL